MKKINLDLMKDTIIIGIGNISRGDDGLGWAFLDNLESREFSFNIVYRYQLSLEDAELISRYKQVIFVDASVRDMKNGYSINRVLSTKQDTYFSHHLPPDTLLDICSSYFQKNPKAWLIEIKGVSFELGDGLSAEAAGNLKKVLEKFIEWVGPLEVVDVK
jgi:hydrogenase maturation protease